jgi:Bacteriocin-protection, YdeI or OmpD-Associated/Domain of unknown function (DUF1905)
MRFSTTLSQFGNNTGIEVPTEVVSELGAGKRAVVVKVNGFEYRSTLAVMNGKHLLPFSAERRRESGIAGGDPIDVELTVDGAPRTVDVPDDLQAALAAAPSAATAWEKLAPSYKKEHVTAVLGAKAAETRVRRIAAVVTKLGG